MQLAKSDPMLYYPVLIQSFEVNGINLKRREIELEILELESLRDQIK